MGLDYNLRMAWQQRRKSGVVFVTCSPDSPTRLDSDHLSREAERLGGLRRSELHRTVLFLLIPPVPVHAAAGRTVVPRRHCA